MKFKIGQRVKFFMNEKDKEPKKENSVLVTGNIYNIVSDSEWPIRVEIDKKHKNFIKEWGDLLSFTLIGTFFNDGSVPRIEVITPPLLKRRKDDSRKNETPTTPSK